MILDVVRITEYTFKGHRSQILIFTKNLCMQNSTVIWLMHYFQTSNNYHGVRGQEMTCHHSTDQQGWCHTQQMAALDTIALYSVRNNMNMSTNRFIFMLMLLLDNLNTSMSYYWVNINTSMSYCWVT